MKKKLFLPFTFLSLTSVFFPSCDGEVPPRTEEVIGTVCTVNAFKDGSKKLYDQLFNRLHEIDRAFSVHISDSDISRLNAASGRESVVLSPDVFYVLEQSVFYADLCDGIFDPSVGPLVQLWDVTSDNPHVPEIADIKNAQTLVNYKDIVLDKKTSSAFLKKEGMAIDLGGIAKGFAADELVKILKEKKVKRALINLGGNVSTYGIKENGNPWKIGIRDPIYGNELAAALSIEGSMSVVTSGIGERYFMKDGVRYHHIIDVRSGYPGDAGYMSSSIISSSSIQADALSTISFLAGPAEFKKILEKIPDGEEIAFVFIDRQREFTLSDNIKENFESMYE